MAYWLAKSEPTVYSWDDLVKEKQTCWSGIRNYAARLHMRNMKTGDEVFFYHSNEGTNIVGIAKVNELPRGKPAGYLRTVSIDLNIPSHTRSLSLGFQHTF